ncbi:MAG: hypothetical protein ACFE85_13930 [Candidatus Hodarchaeota archaeon]
MENPSANKIDLHILSCPFLNSCNLPKGTICNFPEYKVCSEYESKLTDLRSTTKVLH